MAAGATYEPIATTTLGSAASSITFSSIPSTYTDLRVVFTGTSSTAGQDVFARLNGDTATNYSQTNLYGNGTTAGSSRNTSIAYFLFTSYVVLSTTIPLFITLDIFSYAGSTYKTLLTTINGDQNGSGAVQSQSSLWRSTSAVNSVNIYTSGGNFNAGTTATIYGIKAA